MEFQPKRSQSTDETGLRPTSGASVLPSIPTIIVTDGGHPRWPTWAVPWLVAVILKPVTPEKLSKAMVEVMTGR